jgi:N6-L-threonylcarbamoyladenine synthase
MAMSSEISQRTFPQNEPLPPARILGIETSCDETAVSVVENGNAVLSSKVASQAELHARFGGVFPEVASRQHIRTIYKILDESLHQAHLTLSDVDAVAVTRGPGLPGSLVVGLNMAKGLALATGLPLVGVNHLEGHIYSAWIQSDLSSPRSEPQFPLLILIVSGGHTELVLMEDHLRYRRLGGTLDDAAGEAFDKVARLLGLSYPGGPSIQRAAEIGNSAAFSFPRAMMDDSWDFSFSGLKTAVLRQVRALQKYRQSLPVADLAASFQAAVVDVLVSKTIGAAVEFNASEILIAGGVSANRTLREMIRARADCRVHIPPIWLCTDNAAMIAAAGYYRFVAGQRDELDIDALPNWPVSEI